MTAAATPEWHVCKQLVAEHWDGFPRVQPRYQRSYYDGLVEKRLGCGNPEKVGDIVYRCLPGGEGPHRVAMSCKASQCLRWAKVDVANWGSQVRRRLPEGVIYRPSVLTVPALVRPTCQQNARGVLRACMRWGGTCLEAVCTRVSGRTRKGGSIVVLQRHGRHGQYHPHLPLIATRGGWDHKACQWVHLADLPYPL